MMMFLRDLQKPGKDLNEIFAIQMFVWVLDSDQILDLCQLLFPV